MSLYRLRSARVRFRDGSVLGLPDLDIEPGERVGIVGANGLGKTTLLRTLAFLDQVEGTFQSAVSPAEVAFVAQRPYLFPGTVVVNVGLALVGRGVAQAERHRRAREALERLGGLHLAGRLRSALSEGERQRVALARAFVVRPRVMLLDEALGPLDGDGASRLLELLHDLRGATIIAAAPDVHGMPFGEASRSVSLEPR